MAKIKVPMFVDTESPPLCNEARPEYKGDKLWSVPREQCSSGDTAGPRPGPPRHPPLSPDHGGQHVRADRAQEHVRLAAVEHLHRVQRPLDTCHVWWGCAGHVWVTCVELQSVSPTSTSHSAHPASSSSAASTTAASTESSWLYCNTGQYQPALQTQPGLNIFRNRLL